MTSIDLDHPSDEARPYVSLIESLTNERDSLRAELNAWRNCYMCLECGPHVRADEDGCCATCGQDCILVVDGRLARGTREVQSDAMAHESQQALRTALAQARAEVERLKSELEMLADAQRAERLRDEAHQYAQAAQDENERLRAEVERLTACLVRANANHEHFEREWYLRGDEIERLTKERAERAAAVEQFPSLAEPMSVREILDMISKGDFTERTRLLAELARVQVQRDTAIKERDEARLAARQFAERECEELREDARRYRRLRVLGCIPFYVSRRTTGALRLQNLDETIDKDIAAHPSRGEAATRPSQAKGGVMAGQCFDVWCPDWESEEDADDYIASSSQDAAEQYAEAHFDDPFTQIDLMVRRVETGEVKRIRVVVDFEPTFTGCEVMDDEQDESCTARCSIRPRCSTSTPRSHAMADKDFYSGWVDCMSDDAHREARDGCIESAVHALTSTLGVRHQDAAIRKRTAEDEAICQFVESALVHLRAAMVLAPKTKPTKHKGK